jgi:hypothetical protein
VWAEFGWRTALAEGSTFLPLTLYNAKLADELESAVGIVNSARVKAYVGEVYDLYAYFPRVLGSAVEKA